MQDIVERLRTQSRRENDFEAANEIERLREKVEMVMGINHQQGDEIERLKTKLAEYENVPVRRGTS